MKDLPVYFRVDAVPEFNTHGLVAAGKDFWDLVFQTQDLYNPEKGLPDGVALKQFGSGSFLNDPPGLQDIAPATNLQGLPDVLFHQQNGHSPLLQFLYYPKDLVHQ